MAVASALFGFSFYVLVTWLEQGRLSDVPIYVHYANLMRGGAFPYRDFAFEYPPAALPAMLVPSYMSWSYATSFAVLMGACGAGCIALVASALREVEAGAARTWAALLLLGASPLILGSFGMVVWRRGFTDADRVLFKRQSAAEAVTLPPPRGSLPGH